MAFNNDLIAFVDARIDAKRRQDIAKGTAVTDSATGVPTIGVIMDGSSVTAIVKLYGTFDVAAGDRVGLMRIGTEWVVTGTFTRKALGILRSDQALGSGSTNSGTFSSVTGWTPGSFTKSFDKTRVTIYISMSAFTSVATGTGVDVAVQISGQDVNDIASHYFNNTTLHLNFSGTTWHGGGGIPAGSYTVDVLWRRYTGTGTVQCDSNDHIRLLVKEEAVS